MEGSQIRGNGQALNRRPPQSLRTRMGWAKILGIAAAAAGLSLASCTPHRQRSNDTVFVSDETGSVTLLDGATGKIEGRLATGPRPRGIALAPARRTFYVAPSNAHRIEALDARKRRLPPTYGAASDPDRLAISPDR